MPLNFGRYKVETSNEDKILFPQEEISKMDVINYYSEMADFILPFTKDSPVTMHRFPDGIESNGFYQKDASDYFPDWIDTKKVDKEDGKLDMVLINKKATLAYLANQACLTPHIWLSKIDKPHQPNKIVFDLDPPENDFMMVIEGAKALRAILENELGLQSFVMTSGSKGLHVVVPIRREDTFDTSREFSKAVSEIVAKKNSDRFTTEVRKVERSGRLFIDYLRNSYAQTSVTPYAIRALAAAPIACPIKWKELGNSVTDAQAFNFKGIKERIKQVGDVWEDYSSSKNSLKKAKRILQEITNS